MAENNYCVLELNTSFLKYVVVKRIPNGCRIVIVRIQHLSISTKSSLMIIVHQRSGHTLFPIIKMVRSVTSCNAFIFISRSILRHTICRIPYGHNICGIPYCMPIHLFSNDPTKYEKRNNEIIEPVSEWRLNV